MSDMAATELGRYLRARRAQVTPEDAGLPSGTGVRRTPGLRREELATLAGVSVDYYTRLERGRETNPSAAVLDALARTLQLSDDGRGRLHELAEVASGRFSEPRATTDTTVRPAVLAMLDALGPLPAYVVSRHNDVLAANLPGRRIYPGMWDGPREHRNVTRYLFLDPVGRHLLDPWHATVSRSVAHLRAVGGTDVDSPRLTALVGELLLKSPEFSEIWERYEVCERSGGTKTFDHPEAGRMTLTYEVMLLARTGGQRMVVYQADPNTVDEKAMLSLSE